MGFAELVTQKCVALYAVSDLKDQFASPSDSDEAKRWTTAFWKLGMAAEYDGNGEEVIAFGLFQLFGDKLHEFTRDVPAR